MLDSVFQIPSYFLLVLLGLLFSVGVLTVLIDDALPTVVKEQDAVSITLFYSGQNQND